MIHTRELSRRDLSSADSSERIGVVGSLRGELAEDERVGGDVAAPAQFTTVRRSESRGADVQQQGTGTGGDVGRESCVSGHVSTIP